MSAQRDDEAGLGPRWRGLCSACRQVFGMPDYERYLAHAARRHPDAPVLTRGGSPAGRVSGGVIIIGRLIGQLLKPVRQSLSFCLG